jgi:hypothetical protein
MFHQTHIDLSIKIGFHSSRKIEMCLTLYCGMYVYIYTFHAIFCNIKADC